LGDRYDLPLTSRVKKATPMAGGSRERPPATSRKTEVLGSIELLAGLARQAIFEITVASLLKRV